MRTRLIQMWRINVIGERPNPRICRRGRLPYHQPHVACACVARAIPFWEKNHIWYRTTGTIFFSEGFPTDGFGTKRKGRGRMNDSQLREDADINPTHNPDGVQIDSDAMNKHKEPSGVVEEGSPDREMQRKRESYASRLLCRRFGFLHCADLDFPSGSRGRSLSRRFGFHREAKVRNNPRPDVPAWNSGASSHPDIDGNGGSPMGR